MYNNDHEFNELNKFSMQNDMMMMHQRYGELHEFLLRQPIREIRNNICAQLKNSYHS